MKEKIKKVMMSTFELSEIEENISQKNCEKWDSLNHLNLIVALESEFDISIEPEEISEMKTIKDIENILESKI